MEAPPPRGGKPFPLPLLPRTPTPFRYANAARYKRKTFFYFVFADRQMTEERKRRNEPAYKDVLAGGERGRTGQGIFPSSGSSSVFASFGATINLPLKKAQKTFFSSSFCLNCFAASHSEGCGLCQNKGCLQSERPPLFCIRRKSAEERK